MARMGGSAFSAFRRLFALCLLLIPILTAAGDRLGVCWLVGLVDSDKTKPKPLTTPVASDPALRLSAGTTPPDFTAPRFFPVLLHYLFIISFLHPHIFIISVREREMD
jgi:hypothetical protein